MWLYLTLGLTALVIYLLRRKSDYWDKKGVPTASGCEFIFGHFRPVIFMTKHANYIYDAMYKEFPDAPLVGYYVMSLPALLVKDLDLIRHIMVSEFASFNFSGVNVDKKTEQFIGSSPFFLVGEEWKTARYRISAAQSLAKLKGYLPSIMNVGDEMAKYIKNNCGPTAELDAREIAAMFTTDVIANAIFGVKNNTFENKDSLFALLTRNIGLITNVKTSLKFFLQQIPIVRSLFPARFTTKLQQIIKPLVSKIITERMASGEKRNDALQALISLKENDTKGVITNEVISACMFATIVDLYDSSRNIIAFMLCRLARHPEIQEKLRNELKEMKSKIAGDFTLENIENAKYLNMVTCEALRTYSMTLVRECTKDCYLPVKNSKPIKISKGTAISIPTPSIHMDEKYYPDPETFNPERFTDEEVAKRPKFTFMPFGEGPKICIGWRLSTLQIKILLAKIIENFALSPSLKTKYPLEYDPTHLTTIRPKGGTWVILEEIK